MRKKIIFLSPSDPQEVGNSSTEHDGMPDAGHEAQVGHAGGQDK